jgi:hypothetical protein
VTDERLRHLWQVAPLLWPAPLRSHAGRGRARTPGTTHAVYLLLPDARRPRLLVPGGCRPAAGALRRYGVGRGRAARWQAALLAAGMATGIAPLLLRDRLTIMGPPGDQEPIEAHLADVLGRRVLISMYLGPARANRKPVLQVLTPAGRTIAFVKVGVDALTRRLIREETAALRDLAAAGLERLAVAEVLHSGAWHGAELLVQSALPVGGRGTRPDRALVLAAQKEVATIGSSHPAPLRETPYWARLTARLAALPPGAEAFRLAEVADRVEVGCGDVRLPLGAWHGDWTPWNTAVRNGRLLVWDWERFERDVPVGYDALHWSLQAELVNRLVEPRAAADRLLADPPDLTAFGLDREQARATAAAYLTELALRYVTDGQREAGARLGDVSAWLLPALQAALPGPHPIAPVRERRGVS